MDSLNTCYHKNYDNLYSCRWGFYFDKKDWSKICKSVEKVGIKNYGNLKNSKIFLKEYKTSST